MTREEREQAQTSLRFNQGKLRWGLVHYKSIEPMVRVLMHGAEKYADDNWKKPLSNNRQNLECAQRHLAAMMDGEIYDKESGLPHAGHVMCNMMFFQFHEDKAKEQPSVSLDTKAGTISYTEGNELASEKLKDAFGI